MTPQEKIRLAKEDGMAKGDMTNPLLDAVNNEGFATDAIDQEIDWFNWDRWKESLEDSISNFPENFQKYGFTPFAGKRPLPTGNVALKEQRDSHNEKNPQNGGMNIDMNDRTGPKKTSFNLLNFFGIPESEGSFPTPGEPDYFEPQPGNVYEEGEQG
tara:strand:- start:1080 stop:1550 length:471 start_codon:yes stop_codon:yes gene_type:complete